jgi:spore coat protein U-like protein
MKTTFHHLAATAAAALLSVSAFAADSGDATMGVSASIAQECSIGNIAPLAFGALGMLNNGAQSSADSASVTGGTFDAICTAGTNLPKLKFTSANSSGSEFRLLGVDNSYVVYTLKESGGTPIAYNTAAAFGGFAADGTAMNLAIVGAISAAEKGGKVAQSYSDTITITSSYGL